MNNNSTIGAKSPANRYGVQPTQPAKKEIVRNDTNRTTRVTNTSIKNSIIQPNNQVPTQDQPKRNQQQ